MIGLMVPSVFGQEDDKLLVEEYLEQTTSTIQKYSEAYYSCLDRVYAYERGSCLGSFDVWKETKFYQLQKKCCDFKSLSQQEINKFSKIQRDNIDAHMLLFDDESSLAAEQFYFIINNEIGIHRNIVLSNYPEPLKSDTLSYLEERNEEYSSRTTEGSVVDSLRMGAVEGGSEGFDMMNESIVQLFLISLSVQLDIHDGILEEAEEKLKEEYPSHQSLKSSDGGGCLIATAAFGSELAPQVQFLRELRDNTVLQTTSGTAFMNTFNQFYYSFSPYVADYERENPVFKEAVKVTLTPLLTSLTLLNYVDIDTEEEMLGYGIGIILLNVGMYFVAPVILVISIKNKLRK